MHLRLPRKLGVKSDLYVGFVSKRRDSPRTEESQNNNESLTPTAATGRFNANPFSLTQPNIKLAGQRL
jgi:hypothetical protein